MVTNTNKQNMCFECIMGLGVATTGKDCFECYSPVLKLEGDLAEQLTESSFFPYYFINCYTGKVN
ncbi:MAG: hypothetical protein ACRD8Z_22460 [Nitrososphaeraceae archaeon]